jgi:hypothetical protein
MDNLTFAVTLLIVGMGDTMAALGVLVGIMTILKKFFLSRMIEKCDSAHVGTVT